MKGSIERGVSVKCVESVRTIGRIIEAFTVQQSDSVWPEWFICTLAYGGFEYRSFDKWHQWDNDFPLLLYLVRRVFSLALWRRHMRAVEEGRWRSTTEKLEVWLVVVVDQACA